MSETTGKATAYFTNSADFSYLNHHKLEFERDVDGKITGTVESTKAVHFNYRVAVGIAFVGGALTLLINKFFPTSRFQVMLTESADQVPFTLNVETAIESRTSAANAAVASSPQYNVDFSFKDQDTFNQFFSNENLKVCLSREVNNDANTCWITLLPTNFNAGQSSVGWDVSFTAIQVSKSVATEGGVITPPKSTSPPFKLGQQVALQANGYWDGQVVAGPSNDLCYVVNSRSDPVYFGLSQVQSGSSEVKPIYAAPFPVSAQTTQFSIEQNLYVWGSNTVQQGQVTATTYTNNSKFQVSPSTRPTVHIYKNSQGAWVFSAAAPPA